MVAGRTIVEAGRHQQIDAPVQLAESVKAVEENS
jgi:hypothetical protein